MLIGSHVFEEFGNNYYVNIIIINQANQCFFLTHW